MRHHVHSLRWLTAAVTCAATIALLAGSASAWDVRATADEVCAPDKHHWEATVTITNRASTTYTVGTATLDTSAWAPGAAVVGLAKGLMLQPGEATTLRAVGIPLTTGGALLTYTGRYGTGADITYNVTLYRPSLTCEEQAAPTTTEAVAPDTTEATVPETTTPTVTPATTTTTVAPVGTTTTTTLAGPKIIGWVESTTTKAPAQVLGEEITSTTAAELAKTGAQGAGNLVLGALLLTLLGGVLVLAVTVTPRRGS